MKKLLLFLFIISFSADAQLMIQRSWTKDYLAVLSASTTAGHTNPDYQQRKKQNRVVRRLHRNSLWADFDVIWILANNGGQDFARFNWKDPSSFKLTLVNSPTFTTNVGFKSNGTTSYIETGWAPGTNGVQFTRDDAMYVTRTPDDIKESGIMFGVEGATSNTSRVLLNPENTTDEIHFTINNASVLDPVPSSVSNGYYVGYRGVSTATDVWKDNTTNIAHAATSQSRATRTMTICAFKSAPSDAVINFCTRNVNFLLLGNSMGSDAGTVKKTALYNILNDYINSL